MTSGEITPGSISRVLIAGFSLVIVLLLTAGFIGIRNIQSIKENAASLVNEQRVTTRLIGEIQQEQSTLSAVFYKLARGPDTLDYEQILVQLAMIDEDMDRIASEAKGTPQESLWSQLNEASQAFSVEARRLLMMKRAPMIASRDLFRRHEQVISIISRLVGNSYLKVTNAQYEIDRRSARLMKESIALSGGSLLLALVTTVLTVRVTAALFRRMEWQTGELSRVSWHMLEDQESTARRFSHELHDELGQSLTAVKANLVAALNHSDRRAACAWKIAFIWWTRRSAMCGRCRNCCARPSSTISDWRPACAGWARVSGTHGNRGGIRFQSGNPAARRYRDPPVPHRPGGADQCGAAFGRENRLRRTSFRRRRDPARQSATTAEACWPRSRGRKSLGMIGMRARARSAGGELRLGSSKAGGGENRSGHSRARSPP